MKRLLNTLYITTQGAWLSRDGETIVVTLEKQVLQKFPIHTLNGIVCFGRIGATPPLLAMCAERGVAVSFLSEQGKFLVRTDGPVRGNVLLRRQQYRIADNEEKSSKIAASFLMGKIMNARTVLLRAAREDSAINPESLTGAAKKLSLTLSENFSVTSPPRLDLLRGHEGYAARYYFDVFDNLILSQKEHFKFIDRNRRPPTDFVNCMLSYVYTLLTHDVMGALEAVGLDTAVGFLHRDRPGRPSLALDLMEEFRPWLADRLVLTLINRREITHKGFEVSESMAVSMDKETRTKLITAWQERKRDELMHPFLGEKISIGMLPHIQAQILARHIRGDLDAYPPFVWR